MNGTANPILTRGVGDDPSTAWRTEAGEWTFIGNDVCSEGKGKPGGAPLYGTMDWRTFYKKGCTSLSSGDCPTLFALPELTPGSEVGLTATQRAQLPSHVHKCGDKHNNDHFIPGNWTDGRAGSHVGTWQAMGAESLVDSGLTHAAKDFFDPLHKRRILWTWAQQGYSSMTVARHLTYDPRTHMVNSFPVPELAQLRTRTLGTIAAATTPTDLPVSSACDIEVTFARPTAATTLAVRVQGGTFTVEYVPGSSVNVSFVNSTSLLGDGDGSNFPTDVLPMLATDTTVSLRILLDADIAEAYFQRGRVAMTVEIPRSRYTAKVLASPTARLINASSWQMGSIWHSREQVLATPRLDGQAASVAE